MNIHPRRGYPARLLVISVATWLLAAVVVAVGVGFAIAVALNGYAVYAAAALAATFALFYAVQGDAFRWLDEFERAQDARRQPPQPAIPHPRPVTGYGRHACDSPTRTIAAVPAGGESR